MSIVENRKASHDYFIEERFEAGVALQGWEAKAIRAGRVQLAEAYVVMRNGELNLIGCHISPLLSASTHVQADPTRTRKLLMHAEELRRLIGKVERRGLHADSVEPALQGRLDQARNRVGEGEEAI
jgi:SsrA-binding protein